MALKVYARVVVKLYVRPNTGLAAGSAVVALEAPTLADAAPDRFGGTHQVSLFAEPHQLVDASNSAVDIFAGVLASVVQGDRDRVLADRALLDTCVRFVRAARDSYQGIQLESIAGLAAPLVVYRDDVSKIERLRDETPGPKAVRVTGTLDTISATKSDVVLALTDGTTVAARLDAHDNEQLKALFGSRVVVSGLAQFRPSGRLLVIDVEHLGPARDGDVLFERAPRAAAKPVASLLPQDEATGVSAFFGTWPGDETDEELLSALEGIHAEYAMPGSCEVFVRTFRRYLIHGAHRLVLTKGTVSPRPKGARYEIGPTNHRHHRGVFTIGGFGVHDG
jgi:hypothetical protein